MSKDDKTQTSTSTSSLSPWIENAQQGLYGVTTGMVTPYLSTGKGYNPVAGFTKDQNTALSNARRMMSVSKNSDPTSVTAGQPTWQDGTAQNVNGGMIQSLLNPFTQSVIDTTSNSMNRQNDRALAGIRGRQAASASFGGSRGAVGERLQNEGFEDQMGQMVANLNLQGWNNASNLAQYNVGQNNSMEALNTQGANAMNVGNADRQLTAASLNDAFKTSEQNRDTNAIKTLMGIGDKQQQTNQARADVPWQMLQILNNATPKTYGQTTTTTSPDNSASPLQQMLGLGLTVAGLPMGGGSSVGGNFLKSIFGK